MPRQKNVLPSYLLHQSSGQARVRIDGRDHLLGPYGSEESRIEYAKLVAKIAGGQSVDPLAAANGDSGPSVAELLLAFKTHAEAYYVKGGKSTAEVDCFNSAMRPVRELFDMLPAKDFGPLNLKAVQLKYVDNGWTRGFANKSINRVRHIWKWGVSCDLVPVTTLMALQTVPPLKTGHTGAPDNKRRTAVDEETIAKVRPFLGERNRDLFDLLRHTGARPAELISLTMVDIDTSGEVWVAELVDHKNANRGLSRKLYFGPKSQLVLRRCPSTGPLFNIRRSSFSAAVKRACVEAGVDPFVPYSLRHTRITEVRDTIGIEAAQATGGHAKPDMTAKYSTKMDKLGRKAAKRCG